MLGRVWRRSRSWITSGVLDSVKGRGDVRVRDEFRKSRFQLIDACLQLLRKNMKAMDSSHTIVQAGTAAVRFLLSVGDNGGAFFAINAQRIPDFVFGTRGFFCVGSVSRFVGLECFLRTPIIE